MRDLIFEGDIEEEFNKYDLCFVDRFLTKKISTLEP